MDAGQQCPGGQGAAGPEAQEQEGGSHQETPQHGEHKAEQSPRRRRGDLDVVVVGGAAGGVLEEGRDAAADAVGPAAVGRGGAGGVRGLPRRLPRRRRPRAPPLRPPLPLGLRTAVARGHVALPLLPRRRERRRQQPPQPCALRLVTKLGRAAVLFRDFAPESAERKRLVWRQAHEEPVNLFPLPHALGIWNNVPAAVYCDHAKSVVR